MLCDISQKVVSSILINLTKFLQYHISRHIEKEEDNSITTITLTYNGLGNRMPETNLP